MWHSSQVKLRHGKNCANCGGSVTRFIGLLHFGQRRRESLLFPSIVGSALRTTFLLSEKGDCDGRYRKRGKLNEAVAVHRLTKLESEVFSHSRR